MAKKIFFSDIVDKSGEGLKTAFSAAVAKPLAAAWHYASGNNRMDKRGIRYDDEGLVFTSCALGTLGGLAIGMFTGGALVEMQVVQNGLPHFFAIWGSMMVGAPVASKQIANAYRVSEHDKKVYLLEQRRKEEAAQLPSPAENEPKSAAKAGKNKNNPLRMT